MRIILLALVLSLPYSVISQDILGFWNGKGSLMGQSLRLEFEISKSENGLEGVFRSPDQNDKSHPLSKVEVKSDSVFFHADDLSLVYRGAYNPESEMIMGEIVQMGMVVPVILQREKLEPIVLVRPQEPKAPFPYSSKNTTFQSRAGHSMTATVTLPNGKVKAAVVLIAGSGAQDRNSEILGHKPFLVWADHLARNGIATFRYDERGVAESKGIHSEATTFDLAEDALDGLIHLKSLPGMKKVPCGMMGHSEGGLIVAIAAAQSPLPDFVISLAGPGVNGSEVLVTQSGDIALAEGLPLEAAMAQRTSTEELVKILLENSDSLSVYKGIDDYVRSSSEISQPDEMIPSINGSMNNVWMRAFVKIDPREYWSKVKCPVLALNGNKDTQVDFGSNLRAIEFSLKSAENKNYETMILKNHNHLFQETENGAPSLYGSIEQTVSPAVMNKVSEWLTNLTL